MSVFTTSLPAGGIPHWAETRRSYDMSSSGIVQRYSITSPAAGLSFSSAVCTLSGGLERVRFAEHLRSPSSQSSSSGRPCCWCRGGAIISRRVLVQAHPCRRRAYCTVDHQTSSTRLAGCTRQLPISVGPLAAGLAGDAVRLVAMSLQTRSSAYGPSSSQYTLSLRAVVQSQLQSSSVHTIHQQRRSRRHRCHPPPASHPQSSLCNVQRASKRLPWKLGLYAAGRQSAAQTVFPQLYPRFIFASDATHARSPRVNPPRSFVDHVRRGLTQLLPQRRSSFSLSYDDDAAPLSRAEHST